MTLSSFISDLDFLFHLLSGVFDAFGDVVDGFTLVVFLEYDEYRKNIPYCHIYFAMDEQNKQVFVFYFPFMKASFGKLLAMLLNALGYDCVYHYILNGKEYTNDKGLIKEIKKLSLTSL